jgi:hypothetical protein
MRPPTGRVRLRRPRREAAVVASSRLVIHAQTLDKNKNESTAG